jgi:hypothetical protein
MASVKYAGLISLAFVVSGGPAVAQQGTEAQREACTPDAFRLCTSAMPDAGRVEACLREAGARLSPACYAVFNPPQQSAESPGSGRDRGARQQREVQRQPDRRDDNRRTDQSREFRRDDGFGAVQRRDDLSRPQSRYYNDD